MSESSDAVASSASHVLPGWFHGVRTHVMLSALIIAQWIVNTVLIVLVSIKDPSNPFAWSWLDWSMAVVALFVGAAAAGMGLALSASAAEAFNAGRLFRALFAMLGLIFFSSAGIWAGIAERSVSVHATPADAELVAQTGLDMLSHIPPSIIIVAALLEVSVFFYGWTSRPKQIESAADRAERIVREKEEAQLAADLRLIKAAGFARAGRAAWQSVRGKSDTSADDAEQLTATSDDDEERPANVVELMPATKKRNVPTWNAKKLIEHVDEVYHVALSERTALDTVREKGDLVGREYRANVATLRAWARGVYASEKGAEPVAINE